MCCELSVNYRVLCNRTALKHGSISSLITYLVLDPLAHSETQRALSYFPLSSVCCQHSIDHSSRKLLCDRQHLSYDDRL